MRVASLAGGVAKCNIVGKYNIEIAVLLRLIGLANGGMVWSDKTGLQTIGRDKLVVTNWILVEYNRVAWDLFLWHSYC